MSKGIKIARYTLWALLLGALGSYLYFAYQRVKQEQSVQLCRNISIKLQDASRHPLLSEAEIDSLLFELYGPLRAKNIENLDCNEMEARLSQSASIASCNIVIYRTGDLKILVSQHHPVMVIETPQGPYYATAKGYLFPAFETQRVKGLRLKGNVPFNYPKEYRGPIAADDSWLQQTFQFCRYIQNHAFWSPRIDAVYVQNIRDIRMQIDSSLCLKIGGPEQYEYKMTKLRGYFEKMASNPHLPQYGVVDAQYGDQLVCSQRTHH